MAEWIKERKGIVLFLSLFVFFYGLLFFTSSAKAVEITGTEIKVTDNEIYVTTSLSLDEKQLQDLKNGLTKEITFYIDLFRIWNMWPDEFVLGKIIVKTLKSDPIKKEYVALSFDGATLVERRFNELESLLKWSLNIKNLKLTNIKELESADYFIRVTVESRARKLPPVISYLFFFVPEKEFKEVKDSQRFHIGMTK